MNLVALPALPPLSVSVRDRHLRRHVRYCTPSCTAALLPELPRPLIHDDSFNDMGVGCATIVKRVPGLQPRLDELRAKYARQITSQWPTMSTFLAQNRADWKEACQALSSDANELAFPYIWDGFIKGTITRVVHERLPWPFSALVGGLLGLLPVSWLPLPGGPRKTTAVTASGSQAGKSQAHVPDAPAERVAMAKL